MAMVTIKTEVVEKVLGNKTMPKMAAERADIDHKEMGALKKYIYIRLGGKNKSNISKNS